jgi:hypothetical protein
MTWNSSELTILPWQWVGGDRPVTSSRQHREIYVNVRGSSTQEVLVQLYNLMHTKKIIYLLMDRV